MKLGNLIFIVSSSIVLVSCGVSVNDEMGEAQEESRPYMQNTNIENVDTQASPYQYMHQSKEESAPATTAIAEPNPSPTLPTLKAKRSKISRIQTTPTESTPIADNSATANQNLSIDNAPKDVPVTNILSNWHPNEAQVIRGKELIAGLQRDIGHQPNTTEMQQRLKTHMGLSDLQSQHLITILEH